MPGQDGVDAADGALGHALADMRAAAGQRAVVARARASDLEAWTRVVSGRLACDRRRPPVADVHQPFVGERSERAPYGAGFQPLEPGELGHRRPAPIRAADRPVGLEVGNFAVLDEWLAGARELAASHKSRYNVSSWSLSD
jgi:hypothetical protein